MESKHNKLFISFREKIKQLITLYEEQKSKNKELKTRNIELKNKINLLEKKLTDLELKYNNTKLAKAILATGENSHDAKIKVNRIVREIDKCIALLNR